MNNESFSSRDGPQLFSDKTNPITKYIESSSAQRIYILLHYSTVENIVCLIKRNIRVIYKLQSDVNFGVDGEMVYHVTGLMGDYSDFSIFDINTEVTTGNST